MAKKSYENKMLTSVSERLQEQRGKNSDEIRTTKTIVSDGMEKRSEDKSVKERTWVKKKSRVVSAKFYPDTWETFTAINRAKGMTNNSVLNDLVTRYVIEEKKILKEI